MSFTKRFSRRSAAAGGLLLVLVLACVSQAASKDAKAAPAGKPDEQFAADFNARALRMAIADLSKTFPGKYDANHLRRMDEYEKALPDVMKGLKDGSADARRKADEMLAFKRQALLANPLLDFGRIIAVSRNYKDARKIVSTCTPSINAYCLESVNPKDHPAELVVVSNFRDKTDIRTLYTPAQGGAIAEIDLNFDADRIMYSGLGSNNLWHIHEVSADGKYIRQLTPKDADYSSFDSCYLPDGRVAFTSTAPVQGLPCESGRVSMSNTFLLDPNSGGVRRLTFDQDSNWGLTVMEDGRIMFLRWEYADQPHYFSRVLMTMYPDGTKQLAHYKSNSYWPNCIHTPKPIPGNEAQFIGVLSGHHCHRPGALCLFDVTLGRTENLGAMQMLPGYGKPVEAPVIDGLYGGIFPKFQNPIPLGASAADGAGRYFLVSCKPTPDGLWGVYLIDIYDNLQLIAEMEGKALNEPIPFRKTRRPPVLADTAVTGDKESTVHIVDIYSGPGLKDVPRGKVKNLRLFTYHFAYSKSGSHEAVGIESSWDIKRVLGTVPLAADGSATFKVPANTPIAIQPLDENGASLQLMRSWFTAMPGENISCVGCHENQNAIQSLGSTAATGSKALAIQPWQGPARNFTFLREVQPVLQHRCVGCHNGKAREDGKKLPNFADISLQTVNYEDGIKEGGGGPFSRSYLDLVPYVRRPGPESDVRLLNPMEYHANTSLVVQMLNKGHHGVTLSAEEWQRIYAWIDMNAPFWGTWTDAHRDWANEFHRRWAGCGATKADQLSIIQKNRERRNHWQKLYANIDDANDPESEVYTVEMAAKDLAGITSVAPPKQAAPAVAPTCPNWPLDAKAAQALQKAPGPDRMELDTPAGKIAFRRIPAGEFVMGDAQGASDETPHVAKVEKAFWLAEMELTNAQYHAVVPGHDSGFVDIFGKDHHNGGINANEPGQPVVRVSWAEAVEFCKLLSARTGKTLRLPTEAEWEWAARAGTATPLYWGNFDSDFGKFANLADASMKKFNHRQTFNYFLRVDSVNDGSQIECPGGKYQPNAFGLYDMIGNVAEWTLSDYKAYPYKADDGRNKLSLGVQKVSRGGSWLDLPRWTRVSCRTPYETYQRVHNVGFRLAMEDAAK